MRNAFDRRRELERYAGRRLTFVGGVITDSTRLPLRWKRDSGAGAPGIGVGPWEGDAKGLLGGLGSGFTLDGSVGIWPACNFNYMEYGDGTFGIAALNLGDTTNATVTADNTVAFLFGSKSIVYTANAGGAVRAAQEATLSGSDAAGKVWSASVWVFVPSASALVGVSYTAHLMEIAGGSWNGHEGTSTGTFVAGWQRIRVEGYATFAANIGNLNLSLAFTAVASGDAIYTSGWQLEPFAICTPYVHTHQNNRLSRNSGYVQGTTVDPISGGNVFSAAQGWVALRIAPGFASTADLYSAAGINIWNWRASGTNQVQLIYEPGTDKWQAGLAPNAAQTQVRSAVQTFSRGDHLTLIIKWDGSNISVSVNGGAFVNAAYTGTPTGMPSTWVLGARQDGVQHAACDFFWMLAGSGTLTDADAATIHANGDTPPTSAPGTPTFVSQFSGGDWIVPTAQTTRTIPTPSFAGASSFGAAVTPYQQMVSTFAGTSSLAAPPTPYQRITSTFAGVGSLSATVIAAKPLTATFAGVGSFSTTVIAARLLSPSFAGVSSLSLTLTPYQRMVPSFTGTSSLSVVLTPYQRIAATFAGTSSLAVTLIAARPITPSFAGTSSLAVTLISAKQIVATFAGSSSLSATVTPYQRMVPSFAGVGSFSVTLTPYQRIVATFAGVGSLTAGLTPYQRMTPTFAGVGSFSATVISAKQLTATFSGSGSLGVTLIAARPLTPTFAGTSSLAVTITPYQRIIATFAGSSSLAVSLSIAGNVAPITATFAGTSSLAATVTPYQRVTPTFSGTSSLAVQAVALRLFTATFAGTSSLAIAVTPYLRFSATFAGVGSLTTALTPYRRFVSTFSGSGSLTVQVTPYQRIAVTFAGTSSLAVQVVALQRAAVTFAGQGLLGVSVGKAPRFVPTFAGVGTLGVTVITRSLLQGVTAQITELRYTAAIASWTPRAVLTPIVDEAVIEDDNPAAEVVLL